MWQLARQVRCLFAGWLAGWLAASTRVATNIGAALANGMTCQPLWLASGWLPTCPLCDLIAASVIICYSGQISITVSNFLAPGSPDRNKLSVAINWNAPSTCKQGVRCGCRLELHANWSR